MAAPALERAGLRRDDAGARYTAQIGARVTPTYSPWGDPGFYRAGDLGPRAAGYGRPAGTAPTWYGPGWYGPGFPPAVSPWYLLAK